MTRATSSGCCRTSRLRRANALINTDLPVISGTPAVDQTLTVSDGTWSGSPTDLDYRWLRCDASGDSCRVILGAAGPTYVPTVTDATHRLAAEVVAGNAAGVAVAGGAVSDPIEDESGM